MKLLLSWLEDHIDLVGVELDNIIYTLNSLGIEVEQVERRYDGFYVCQVQGVEPHPNADSLKVCKVNDGKSILTIVCGASNVRVGLKSVLAKQGTIIPSNNMVIKKSKIRGIESQGMMCSPEELNSGANSEGIIELGDDFTVGHIYKVGDPVIEIAITPNRGDLLSVRGIARDLAAAGLGKLKKDSQDVRFDCSSDDGIVVETKDTSSIVVQKILNVSNNFATPKWMSDRLEAVGMHSISPLVDITNYLALDLGHPMHVYDADKIADNKLFLRDDVECEFVALDGMNYKINSGMKVICDNTGPQSIAGIIGGMHSGCGEETKNVLLEIGDFDSVSIIKTRRKLSISTESSYRFERGIDRGFITSAMNIASKMITDICGGNLGGRFSKIIDSDVKEIAMSDQDILEISGLSVPNDIYNPILENLGFISKKSGKYRVPTWRHDCYGVADLVEEIMRVYGYDKIPTAPMPGNSVFNKKTALDYAKDLMVGRGFYEVITWSFMDSNCEYCNDIKDNMFLMNPIANNLDVMKQCMVPNLVDITKKNIDRGESDIMIFEVGNEYHDIDDVRTVIAGLRFGMTNPRNLYGDVRPFDVFDVKSDALAILRDCYNFDCLKVLTDKCPKYYHPGKFGRVVLGNITLAYFGELHPKVLDGGLVFEVFVDNIPKRKEKFNEHQVSVYQPVRRDFAFIFDIEILSDSILNKVLSVNKDLITDVSIFDLYTGENVGNNKKSVAFTVTIQSLDHSLKKKEIDQVCEKICEVLSSPVMNGVLRDGYNSQ